MVFRTEDLKDTKDSWRAQRSWPLLNFQKTFFESYLQTARGKQSLIHQLAFRQLKGFVVLSCQGENSRTSYKIDTTALLLLLQFFLFFSLEKIHQKDNHNVYHIMPHTGTGFWSVPPNRQSLMPRLRTKFWSTSHCHGNREHPCVKTVQNGRN